MAVTNIAIPPVAPLDLVLDDVASWEERTDEKYVRLRVVEGPGAEKGAAAEMVHPLKIAVISDRVYPFFKGGGEKRYWELAKRLTVRGHEVHFYTGHWPGMQREMVVDGIRIHTVYRVSSFYVNGRKSIKESLAYALAVFPHLMRADVDVIDCEQMPLFPIFTAKLVALLRRKALIVTWYESWGAYWFRYLGRMGFAGYIVERLAVRMADAIISISHTTSHSLARTLNVKEDKIHTIPCGVDTEYIASVEPATARHDIVYAGRLIGHKNIDLLLAAVDVVRQTNPHVRCLIIGDGPERRSLEELVDAGNLRDNVTFAGTLTADSEVYALMKSSRVLVLPSEREGFGQVVVEAMACGIPVVTIDHENNAARHLVTDGKDGYVCARDARDIAKHIGLIVDDRGDRMREHCLRTARKWDTAVTSTKTERLYRRARMEKPGP